MEKKRENHFRRREEPPKSIAGRKRNARHSRVHIMRVCLVVVTKFGHTLNGLICEKSNALLFYSNKFD